jgi:hypothetical protein
MQRSRSRPGRQGAMMDTVAAHDPAGVRSLASTTARHERRTGAEPSPSLRTAAAIQTTTAPRSRRRSPHRDLARTHGVVRCVLAVGLAVLAWAFPASAGAFTHIPPSVGVSGPLWDVRSDGGTGAPVATDLPVTVQVSRDEDCVYSVEMLVDGQRLRPEHLQLYNYDTKDFDGCANVTSRVFTFHPGDIATLAPTNVEVAVIARDGEAPLTATTGQYEGGAIGVDVVRFHVNIPRDTFPPAVTPSHGNLVAGWANDVAEVVFDAWDGTGIQEARLKIDGTVRATATYTCDYSQLRPCPNLSGASLTANVTDLASGAHTWQLELVDAAGNVARTPSTGFETDWIRETIVNQMGLPDSAIVSVGDDEDNTSALSVGMTNPTGLEATDLKARFGDAIAIKLDEEIESLAAPVTGDPVPGADTRRDPMLAGVHITNGRPVDHDLREDCTSGFMYRGLRSDDFPKPEGIITAGHCVWKDPLTWDWKQGGDIVGTFGAHRFVNPTYADAGYITTCCGTGDWRDISNRVFLGSGAPRAIINEKAPNYSGERGDTACISGAYGGYSCGVLVKVGRRTPSGLHRGVEFVIRDGGRRVVVRNVYAMRRDRGSCKGGDSGAPVFRVRSVGDDGTPYGTALGIAFAKTNLGQRCYFSQQGWVEWELNVRTYLGR